MIDLKAFTRDLVNDMERVIHGPEDRPAVMGRLVGKAMHDELTGEAFAVIDGRVHYIHFLTSAGSTMRVPWAGSSQRVRWRPRTRADRRSC